MEQLFVKQGNIFRPLNTNMGVGGFSWNLTTFLGLEPLWMLQTHAGLSHSWTPQEMSGAWLQSS